MKRLKDLYLKYEEIILYLIMGGCTTLVSWVTYAVSIRLIRIDAVIFGLQGNILAANVLSWIFSILFAYITNKIWVFKSRNWKPAFVVRECLLFFSSRALTGLFEIASVPLLVRIGLNQTIFGIEGMVSKVLVSIIVIILNYVLSKLVIFRKKN